MEKTTYFKGATTLSYKKKGNIGIGQDGAIFLNFLLRFQVDGSCNVFTLDTLEKIDHFDLDKKELLMPHSNAVCFGVEKYAETDEFPLLYTNLYNTYWREEDKKEGVLCAYRITRDGNCFNTQLVQVIKVGFVQDTLWKSETKIDERPYGNFVIDTKNQKLYAFVMRDETKKTRVFQFDLPKMADGEACKKCGAKVVTLEKADVSDYFDTDYVDFMQGAVYHEGYIYSLEGFGDNSDKPAALRMLDVNEKKAVAYFEIKIDGVGKEPEWIDIVNDIIYYADGDGNFYEVTFG